MLSFLCKKIQNEADINDLVDELSEASNNSSTDIFIREYIKTVAKYYALFKNINDTDMHVLQTVLTRTTIATNIDRTIVQSAGVPFKEFVVTCRFGGETCNR